MRGSAKEGTADEMSMSTAAVSHQTHWSRNRRVQVGCPSRGWDRGRRTRREVCWGPIFSGRPRSWEGPAAPPSNLPCRGQLSRSWEPSTAASWRLQPSLNGWINWPPPPPASSHSRRWLARVPPPPPPPSDLGPPEANLKGTRTGEGERPPASRGREAVQLPKHSAQALNADPDARGGLCLPPSCS